jgi:heme-degrading monooxygenase HmoA
MPDRPGLGATVRRMPSVIKINAITVAADSGDELAKRFAARAGAVDDQDGFEGFELLQPTDDRTTWLVITRWRDEESFNAWVSSPAFGAGHQSEAGAAVGHGNGEGGGHGHGKGAVGVSSELWSYVVAGGSKGNQA